MAIQLSNEQLEKLTPYVLENYISELVIHCDDSFPHLKKTMGEQELRQALEKGFYKAKEQGFTQRGPVRFYIDLLIAFGYEFNTDPQYYWIQNILRKNSHLSQIERSTILYKQIKRYAEFTSGEDNQFLYQVAEKLDSLSIHNIKLDKANFIVSVNYLLEYIYPEKYALIGSEAMEQLIIASINKAKNEYQFKQLNHISLISVLMFLLGHQFDADPFCAWASKQRTAKDNNDSSWMLDADRVADRLEKRAKIWLTATLKNESANFQDTDLLN